MNRHELAIARTVIYASLFDYPLTLDQVHRTLLSLSLTREQIVAVYDGSPRLRSAIGYRDGFFFPAGRFDLVAERRRREARSRDFLRRHARTLRWICLLPFTRMVALSGSMAHLNLEEGGDLDLFIVTRGAHVWTVTVAMIVLTRLLGVRPVVCVNFVMSDAHLVLEQQDVFTANQVVHLRPLIGGEVFEGFVAANPFIRKLYPNCPTSAERTFAVPFGAGARRLKGAIEAILRVPSPAIEVMCRRAYAWHLRRRASTWRSPEQVSLQPDYLKLHTQSHRQSVLERFDARVEEAVGQGDRAAIA